MKNNLNGIMFSFDFPVRYKNLLIHPIKMREYHIFSGVSSCLLLEKNSITDSELAVRAISMSYLEYLLEVANEENKLLYLLDGLFRLVLNKLEDEDFTIRYDKKDSNGKPVIVIDNTAYTTSDFKEIREIIAEQNMLDLPNEKISKDVRDKLEQAKRFKEKLNKSTIGSLEEQMMALALYTGWKLEDVYNLTIRKFIIGIRRANHMIMSNIYLTASMSGFVKFKDKGVSKGWLADIEVDDKYGDVKMSPEELQSKVDFSDAKGK